MKNSRSILMLTALLSSALLTHSVMADDSIDHSAKASKHSALAASEGLATTASVASAVVAVPVILTGSAVVAGSAVAESVIGESSRSIHGASHQLSVDNNQPLVITQTIITADPAPNKVVATTNITTTTTTTTTTKR